jgi:hypothetical protein
MRTAEERRQYLEQEKRPANNRTERVWAYDDWQEFPIVSVPVDGLLINVDNRRFRAERMWAEAHLARSLDPENIATDERSIESLLLDASHRFDGDQVVGSITGDAEALRKDWERRNQESPFWIRPDGTVRNGNRRLAMIKRAQRAGGDVGLQRVDAIILTEDYIGEAALLEMEQREQLTENFKVRYNDIDYLLALQEAADLRDIDWHLQSSIDEVAGELQTMVEKSKNEVVRDLYAIKYMDAFLEDSGQAGEYHRLLRNLERFRDIGRTMLRVENEYSHDADRVIQVLFAAVRAGTPHLDIRHLRQMLFNSRDRFDSLSEEIATAEEGWTPDAEPPDPASEAAPLPVSDAESTTDTDLDRLDGDEEDSEGPGPEVRNYPRVEVSDAIQLAIDAFESSRQDDLVRMLREARNRLGASIVGDRLRRECAQPSGEKLRSEVAAIVAWADEHRDLADSSE